MSEVERVEREQHLAEIRARVDHDEPRAQWVMRQDILYLLAEVDRLTTERERFREVAENELLALHEGNYARCQIKPAEFEAWRRVWTGTTI